MAEANHVRQFDDDDIERDESSVDPEDSMVAERGPRAPQLRRLGRYRLVREIATGGMASVNLAVTEGLDKLVALKMIHPHLAQEQAFVRMFLDEARIASSISHRNVCNTFDFGEADGRYFIAMDYLAGQSLRDLVIRLRKNPAEADPVRLCAFMAYIMAEACEGLHAAHELKDAQGKSLEVVHRDVSPHNLFVTYDGNISVVDFGIARASDRLQHTATGVLKGKFSYMAPEQVRQLQVDRRADIWSLGVCLWESLTLERLFVRSSQADTLMSVMMDRVRPPSEVRPEIPKSLDAICAKALSRSATQRYATAREMGRDLMQVVRDSGVMVGPVELEQWLERLFARERESARSLMRYAKQSALDDSQTWADGTGASIAHAPTRSGLMPRLTLPPGTTYPPLAEASASMRAAEEHSGSNLERLIAQPLTAMPARPVWQRGLMLGSLVALGALLGVGWGLFGPKDEATPLTQMDVATPEAVIVHAPAAAALKTEPPKVAVAEEQVAVAEPRPEAEPSRVSRPNSEERARPERRARPESDASRSAPAAKPTESIPEPPKVTTAEPAVPAAASAPATSSPSVAAAEQAPPPASALRDAPSPAPQPSQAARPTEPASAPTAQPKAPVVLGARAEFDNLDVEGSLGTGIISRMLSRATPLVERCYLEAAQKAQKNDFKKLDVALKIDEMGAVRQVDASPHPLPGLSGCAEDAFKRLRSDRKPDVGTARVRLQVTLRPR